MFRNIISGSENKFHVSKYNQWESKQVLIRTFEKKQTKNEDWEKNHRRKTNFFIGKYAILWKDFLLHLYMFYNAGYPIS